MSLSLECVTAYLEEAFAASSLSNWMLAILGTVGTIIAISTLRKLSRQTKAAVDAANAAKTSADTSRMAERAYVNLSHVPPGLTFEPANVISVRVQIKNNGRTPANITAVVLRFWTEMELPEQPPYPDMREVEATGFFLPAGDYFFKSHVETTTSEMRTQLIAGERPAWLLGYVDYVDTFNRRHRSGYARRYDANAARDQNNNLLFETRAGYNYDRERQQDEGND